MNRFLEALRRVLASHPHLDAGRIAAKLDQVQQGIAAVGSVVAVLPEGRARTEAQRALDEAAHAVAAAVLVAHTVDIVAAATPAGVGAAAAAVAVRPGGGGGE